MMEKQFEEVLVLARLLPKVCQPRIAPIASTVVAYTVATTTAEESDEQFLDPNTTTTTAAVDDDDDDDDDDDLIICNVAFVLGAGLNDDS